MTSGRGHLIQWDDSKQAARSRTCMPACMHTWRDRGEPRVLLTEKEKQNRVQRIRAKEGAKKIIWIEMCCRTAPFTKYMLNEYRGEDCRAILIDIRPANELHLQVQIDSEYIHFWQGDIRYINKKTIEKIVKGLLDSEIEELHLIQCSFPCQTYSYASIGSGLPHLGTGLSQGISLSLSAAQGCSRR